jgi:site-specific recombinase XerD
MAGKESSSNRWIKSERVGEVMLFLTRRSPCWWMYWEELDGGKGKRRRRGARRRQLTKSTRETDLAFARLVASQLNEELFKRKRFPDLAPQKERPVPLRDATTEFLSYLETLGRGHEHLKNLRGRLKRLADWMEGRGQRLVQDVSPPLLGDFLQYLKEKHHLRSSTVNDYLDAVHNFFGFAIYKRKLVAGPNPAATGRQAELDRLPEQVLPPPTIYPNQINAIVEVANRHHDTQIVNLIVFICEGGLRFQEVQFLQVGDLNLEAREIILDIKKPDLERVRPELRRRCMTAEGLWIPKSRASRRPIHITDRLARVIEGMGLGEPSDWLFLNQAGRQIAENKTLDRLKRYAVDADVLVETHPKTGKPWSLVKWHWLRHYHRTRAHVCKIRREVSKVAMGHAADPIHDHYRGLDRFAFHEEYAKFDSGIDDRLLERQ